VQIREFIVAVVGVVKNVLVDDAPQEHFDAD